MRKTYPSHFLGVATVLFSAFSLAACAGDSVPQEEAAIGSTYTSFEDFEAHVYREPDTGIYIVDGDTPIETREGLVRFYAEHFQDGALIVNVVSGTDDKWSTTKHLNLTYCVSSASFGGNYNAVVQAMASATSAWEQAASVKFIHVNAEDSNCTASNNNVLFDVNRVSGAGYLARAFFPSYGRANRNVLIDASSFGSIAPYTLPGILRHELGHTLGFRHEHTRPESGRCFEDSSWRALTSYDTASVMHYPQCNGSNRGDLVLTAKDVAGAKSLYGSVATSTLDPAFYLERYGDLQAAFGAANFTAAESHWLSSGIDEGRVGSPLFDAGFYLERYDDIRAAYGSTNYRGAYSHFAVAGTGEGRASSVVFDSAFYLGHYPDLQAAFGAANYSAAVSHFVNSGLYEGRASSPAFNVAYYLGRYPDLQTAFGPTNYPAAIRHFVNAGLTEGRASSPTFDVAYYLGHYPDLQAAFGPTNYRAAAYHWLNHGISEGRVGAP